MKFLKKVKNIIKQSGLLNYYYSLREKYRLAYSALLLKLSPLLYVQNRYKRIYGKKPNLKNPVTSDEKLLWLNLYWRHPLKTECGDKYTMRRYVQNQGWGHVLPELLGVYGNSSEIDFNSLPEKFVLKCTHGCGFNIICTNKATLDIKEAKQKLDKWMATDLSKIAGELHYASMKPQIICEQFLDDLVSELPVDYKVYCFYGKAHCIMVAEGRNMEGHTDIFNIYDLGWNSKLPYYKSNLPVDRITQKPEAYDEMIAAAEALSKPFPFVRMDFYNIRGKAVLGEMTFTPAGCIQPGYTDLAQNQLGSLIKLPPRM
jgi:hypothetical protein